MRRLWTVVRAHGRDSLRVALQTAVAAAAVYFIMHALGLGEVSWAVISALFVVQQSLDGTLRKAAGRVGGTVLGSAIGLLAVALLDGEAMTPVRLALAALIVNAIANLRPSLRYGVVAAAVISLDPSGDPFGLALERAVAILIGTVLGAVAATLVWPESATRRALRLSRSALDACRELLKVEIDETVDPQDRKLDPIHGRFLKRIRGARESANAVHLSRKEGPSPQKLVHAILRLWHALVLLDRTIQRRVELGGSSEAAEAVEHVQKRACDYIETVQKRLRKPGPAPSADALDEAVREAETRLSRRAESGGSTPAVQALAFSLGELGRDLKAIGRLLEPQAAR